MNLEIFQLLATREKKVKIAKYLYLAFNVRQKVDE
jgi:hypothetical protein